jgi:hypothetical protein
MANRKISRRSDIRSGAEYVMPTMPLRIEGMLR